MNLPINIDDLFTARTVEWERLEFKAGWNPEDIVRTLCAFANEFMHLCRNMNLADGPDEHARPKNAGLMFFNPEPQKYFPQTQIDVVHFPEGLEADAFTEKIFKGPVHVMLKEALAYLESQVVREKIQKRSDRPQADRFYNYPYAALKEALCNAVYHRSYEIREPIEVRILPDRITIHSFPGPDRSISPKDLKSMKFVSRRYRNRRVGEFLKELEMTEGRGTGIPRMLSELKKNGSPPPVFHTDEDRTFMTVEFPIQPLFLEKVIGEVKRKQVAGQVTGQVAGQVTEEIKRLILVFNGEMSRRQLQEDLTLKSRANFEERYLKPAIDAGWIEPTIPLKPKSRLQRYRLTEKGKQMKSEFMNP